ncbi:hypothetical protein A3D76_02110 [Candidatus Roizmanbacteria bacterium RIFCSPHIGHO2_02_FULL_37_9b]|nr:MAG: hypothetical protein A3D76_02110 [Candidatus Roizmanbacteria bacterium RIFCSPHIGHO2_02_FULL_37_9b]
MLKKILLFFLILAANHFLLATNSYALELRSPRFKIEVEKLDIDAIKNVQTIYTIQTQYGSWAYTEFKSEGYVISHEESIKPLTFSLSETLINFADLAKKQIHKEDMVLSASTENSQKISIGLIQEYRLKNFSGETLDLHYSLSGENIFRPLPDQNTGQFPTIILSDTTQGSRKISFKLDTLPHQPEGTYETVVNFIATPDY